MKYIIKKSFILILTIILGFGFYSCNTDQETVIVPKTLEQYKTELQTFVSNEVNLVDTTVQGYNTGNFKTTTTFTATVFATYKANYLASLNAVQVVLNNADVTITNLVTAQGTLTANGKLFHDNLWTADRRALNDIIVASSTLNTATLVGTTTGTVLQAAKDTFTAAITAAKSVRDSALPAQLAIDNATATLTTAKTVFDAAIIK